MAGGTFGGGNGDVGTPYLVEDFADLDAVRNDLTAHYKQTENIDMAGQSWNPIAPREGDPFSGSYDGDGFLLENLTIDAATVAERGIFLQFSGTLKNTHARNFNVTGGWGSGLLVAFTPHGADLLIENCSATGTLSSPQGTCGGLIGNLNGGVARNSWADVAVEGTNNTFEYGGFVGKTGHSAVLIERCYALGNVKGGSVTGGDGYIGGFAGQTQWNTTIRECFAAGDVEGTDMVGGFAGGSEPTIENCYALGNVLVLTHGAGTARGGGFFGGYYGENMKNCFSAGTVTAEHATPTLGGFVAQTFDTEAFTGCFYISDANGTLGTVGTPILAAELTTALQEVQEAASHVIPQEQEGTLYHTSATTQELSWPDNLYWPEGAKINSVAAGDAFFLKLRGLHFAPGVSKWFALPIEE